MIISKKSPKIVLWDIEVSGIVATTWNLYPESISHENMLQDWFMICAAWKELGKSKIETVSIVDDKQRFKKDNTDDYHVIKQLRAMLEDVDILIHHNGDKFDMKMFTSRLIYHKLPPLPKLVTIDTLKEVKKIAKFTSHRLDFLGKVLCGQGKKSTPSGTWLKCMKGDEKALKLMLDYNKVDVVVLEKVYNALSPYFTSSVHVGVITGRTSESCSRCGSTKLQKRGFLISSTGTKKQRCQCQSCGAWTNTTIPKV